MRITTLLSALCAATLASASPRTAQLYIQPLSPPSSSSSSSSSSSPPPPPTPFAEIAYDASSPAAASVIAYEHPQTPPSPAGALRIGLYDPASARWLSGTSVAGAANFGKGFAPHVVLTVDAAGEVLGAACRGVRIDAGATRDFGPRAVVVVQGSAGVPELGRPVVVAPGGRKAAEEPEKTFLQKYWWMIAIAVLMAMSGGGPEK
ncbi:hypothetical protein ESCO_001757 [Escovopsis weberi]|uniref:Cyclin-dependent protein kinase regulator pho80 n=1 Tax=Escovopsis weberi TaxID=150374 RepID=A0A0M9VWI8_ESCWE|nr:hypothetical protein ESCO_001757 [Escovopsis weberi]